MENESRLTSPGDAAARLRGYEEVRARLEHRGPSPAISLLLLWDAVAMAAFMGAVLLSFGGRQLEDEAMGATIWSTWLMVLPVVVLRSLVRGAQERFSIRKKPSPAYWIAYALTISACLVLLLADVTYAWWVNLLAPALLFMTMAVSPIRQLRSSRAADSELWTNRPLSRPARRATVLIGVGMGLLAVIGTQEWFPNLSLAVMLMLLLGALFGRGLSRAGAEWGSIHWVAFGIVMCLLFVLFLLLSHTSWVTAPISIASGVLTLLVMLLAAFLPMSPSGG